MLPSDGRTPPAWRLLVDPTGRPGAENMAADQGLLEEAGRSGRAFLRLYRWSPACLSLGRNEAALARYDRAALERLGLDVVRRPTGGRAVWHEHEVTYAVAAPVAAFGSLPRAYADIHERLARALQTLGVDATIAERPTARASDRPAACFATAVGGELVVCGRKVVGSAQVRHGRAFLQHGSILLDGSQDVVQRVSRAPGALSGATTISALVGRRVSFEQVADAIVRAWGEPCLPTALERPLPRSAALFSDPSWTWRR